MNLDQMHNLLVRHYRKTRKTRQSVQIQSVVRQVYKKKSKEIDESSPFEDFLRNQHHISSQDEALLFRNLPRKLKVHFPGPPTPPPKLQQIPYTYQIVPKVPFKIPKQKPGEIGEWVLTEGRFLERSGRKNKSLISASTKTEGRSLFDEHERRSRFKSEVKKLAAQMKEKNLSLKQIIKNKGMIKKSHNFYNSTDFFLMCRNGDSDIEQLLKENPQLSFDVDDQKMTGLHWAAREGHANICRVLIQNYNSNCHAKDCYGRTPLHLAVENKKIECIIRIFIEGGHLNALNNNHKTVRMVANDAYIKYLIEKLEEIKFVIKSSNYKDREKEKAELEASVRGTLDESSLYF